MVECQCSGSCLRENTLLHSLTGTRNMENNEMYKKAKKEAKKVVSDTKLNAYDDLYRRLGTWKWEKDIFKLAKTRERNSRDLDHIKCIKSNDQMVLVKDNDITKRWREYFCKLLNEDYVGYITTREDTLLTKHTFFRRIRAVGVRKALKVETNETRKYYRSRWHSDRGLKMLREVEGIYAYRSWGAFG